MGWNHPWWVTHSCLRRFWCVPAHPSGLLWWGTEVERQSSLWHVDMMERFPEAIGNWEPPPQEAKRLIPPQSYGGENKGVWHLEWRDLMLGWKWTAVQNQHKAQTIGSFSLASFNVWPAPEQRFPSAILGALQELVRFLWAALALCRHEGLGTAGGGVLGWPVPSPSSQLSLHPAANMESWNHSARKRPLRPPSPTINQHWQVPQ